MFNLVDDILMLTGGDGVPAARYNNNFSLADPLTLVGLLVMGFIVVISTLSGSSGSSLLLPICLIFFKFDPKVAVAHTTTLATLTCIIRVVYEKMFPNKSTEVKDFVNYHLVMVGTAPAVLGSFLGVQLNHASPIAIIILFATLLQIFLLIFSFKTYLKKKKEEDLKELKEQSLALEEETNMTLEDLHLEYYTEGGQRVESNQEPLIKPEEDATGSDPDVAKLATADEGERLTYDLLEPEDPASNQYGLTKTDIVFILVMILLNPIVTRLRVETSPSWYQVKVCSGPDWVVLIAYLTTLVLFSVLQIMNILKRNENKRPRLNDVELNSKIYCYKFAAGVLIVSFVGGFLSAGSSTLLAMFMIALNIYPFVASSTTLLLAIIFSGSSALIYAVSGRVFLVATLAAGVVALVSTVLTRITLYEKFLKDGKASMIVLFIAITTLISIPSNIFQVLPHIKEDYDSGKSIWTFHSVCPVK